MTGCQCWTQIQIQTSNDKKYGPPWGQIQTSDDGSSDHIGDKYKLQMIRNTDHLGEGQEDPLYLFPHKATPTKG